MIVTGPWLAWLLRPEGGSWIGFGNDFAIHVTLKLLMLAATLGLAVDAHLRLKGGPTEDTLTSYAWHARAVTVLAVLLVAVGAGLRMAS